MARARRTVPQAAAPAASTPRPVTKAAAKPAKASQVKSQAKPPAKTPAKASRKPAAAPAATAPTPSRAGAVSKPTTGSTVKPLRKAATSSAAVAAPANRASSSAASKPKAASKPAAGTRRSRPIPSAFDPAQERPLSELPPLSFPAFEEYEFRVAAEERRRVRMRNEGAFGGLLVAIGFLVVLVAHTPAFLVFSAIGVAAMVAYELAISTLE